jgi:REP element-mobilizing transposase RayT
MARPPRNFEAGIYHIGSTGSDRRALFKVDDDRIDFLDRLARAIWPLGLALLDYVLMGNHYHALVRTPDARLSKALQLLHGGYSRRHNLTHGRSAHLFRAHCFARAITSDADLLIAYRYLARNPVEAGFALDVLDWPWSSARAHAGVEPPRIRLDDATLRDALDDPAGWRARYLRMVRAA